MALRVLLADESPTIKKVFQLALQDFAVEVRPVNIGVDVATVAGHFKPDIIFADVLLQKKNGYEVCAELKQSAELQAIPVVLMWSGFMELDEDKFQAAQANAQLEKPFDVAALRKLVTELVPRTQTQSVSQFLSFPKAQVDATPPPPPVAKPKPDEEFTAVPMAKKKPAAVTDKYRLNLTPDELDPAQIAVDYQVPGETIAGAPALVEEEPEEFTVRPNKIPPPPTAPPVRPMPTPDELDLEEPEVTLAPPPRRALEETELPPAVSGQLSSEQLEKIIREQSAEVIESVVWKVIPELATQIIERELNKLLKDRDSHPY